MGLLEVLANFVTQQKSGSDVKSPLPDPHSLNNPELYYYVKKNELLEEEAKQRLTQRTNPSITPTSTPTPVNNSAPVPANTSTPVTPTPLPGQTEWVNMMMNKNNGYDRAYYDKLYAKAVNSPGGQYYNPPPQPSRAPTGYQPTITIPYSQGGQTTLNPHLAQLILNAFNDVGQATNSASVLNHPRSQTYTPSEISRFGRPSYNYGENASFIQNNIDRTNTDGSIDRGLYRINSNTFNGIMADPFWGKIAREKYGISNWNDMEDPQKNAYMARLIYDRQGWMAWFAAPLNLRMGNLAMGGR